METTTATANAVTSNVRAALLILDQAGRIGLPLPFIVNAGEFDLAFQFDNFAKLTDWAAWMEVPVSSEFSEVTQHFHNRAEGVALDAELTVSCVTKRDPR